MIQSKGVRSAVKCNSSALVFIQSDNGLLSQLLMSCLQKMTMFVLPSAVQVCVHHADTDKIQLYLERYFLPNIPN